MNHKMLSRFLLPILLVGCEHKQGMQSLEPLPDDRVVVRIQDYN
jgi:hypothetical protein